MKQRLGRIFIIAGIILMQWPDVMSQANLHQIYEQMHRYWPVIFIVIGFFFLNLKNRKKSAR